MDTRVFLKVATREVVDGRTMHRPMETKLGERVVLLPEGAKVDDTAQLASALKSTPELQKARFVLLGIPEDIGPRANSGHLGARTLWAAALTGFLNVQSNQFLNGSEIVVLGNVQVDDLMAASDQTTDLQELRRLVAEVDVRVEAVVRAVVAAGKIPMVVGGGHNNCFPIICGVAHGLLKDQGINAINCDPHCDARELEGRHSGNGFSYGLDRGVLHKYSVFGLHESYNSVSSMERLTKYKAQGRVSWVTYDDMMVRSLDDPRVSFNQGLTSCIDFCKDAPCGIELDLDSVENVCASATTPTGMTPMEARRFVTRLARELPCPAYIHLAEGIPRNEKPPVAPPVGKLVSYLVCDFAKTILSK